MRIAVVCTHVPFVWGGAEVLAQGLCAALREHGHRVENVRLPFRWHPAEQVLDHMLAASLTRIPNVDRVIGLKFPAYYVPHECKVIWLLHPHRQAYDFWGGPFQGIPDNASGRAIRQAIFAADRRHLPAAHRLFTISRVNAQRLRDHSGVDAEVLYPPLPGDAVYRSGAPEDYVFLPSRIVANKRQELAVAAMRHVRSPVRLVLAGPAESPGDLARLEAFVDEQGVRARVQIHAGWISEQRKVGLLAGCLGVLYPPFDEDFGFVTVEAFRSAKPVITCTDSGGPLELVEHGVSGSVCEPNPVAMARAIDDLHNLPDRGAQMGSAGHRLLHRLQLDWEHVVAELTA